MYSKTPVVCLRKWACILVQDLLAGQGKVLIKDRHLEKDTGKATHTLAVKSGNLTSTRRAAKVHGLVAGPSTSTLTWTSTLKGKRKVAAKKVPEEKVIASLVNAGVEPSACKELIAYFKQKAQHHSNCAKSELDLATQARLVIKALSE
jgi:hypothetical protein